jgi:hypothetical protein
VISGEALRSATFTYDVWLETTGSSGDGRPLNQSGAVGGTGPEILERYRSGSYRYAFRINRNGNCIFDEPIVGTRSNDQVTDHYGICADPIRFNEGPEHLVFLHDATHKRVQVFTGLEDQPLRICFDATYQGSYAVTSQPLVLGNIPSGERGYRARYFQFAYYGRLLGVSVDPSTREVTGGEVLVNHQAGSDASIGSELPDGGVDDAAPLDDAAPPNDAGPPDDAGPDATEVGDGSLGGGGSSGAGGHGGLAPAEGQPDGMTDASCGCTVPASRSSVGVWCLGLLAVLLGRRIGRRRGGRGLRPAGVAGIIHPSIPSNQSL